MTAGDFQATAQLVDDKRRKCFAVNVFGHDQQLLVCLHDGLKQGHHGCQRCQLFLVQQDDAVFQGRRHFGGICDEIRAEIAAIKLHAFDHFGFCLQALVFFDGDDAFVADLGHRICDLLTNCSLAIGRDGADFGDLGRVADRAGHCLDLGHDGCDRFVDTAFEVHRVHARSDRFHAFFDDGLRQNCCGGCAVASLVIGA